MGLVGCGGVAGLDGPASFQEEGQIQIMTVGHWAVEEGSEGDAVISAQPQSKQDLRVTMLKKGINTYRPIHGLQPDLCTCTVPLWLRLV